jgi:hypothetical protein
MMVGMWREKMAVRRGAGVGDNLREIGYVR